MKRAVVSQSIVSYPSFGETSWVEKTVASGHALSSYPGVDQPSGVAVVLDSQTVSGSGAASHSSGFVGASLTTRAFHVASVTETMAPEDVSLIWTIRPPSPICWRLVPMYSRPVLSSVKSLPSIPTVNG